MRAAQKYRLDSENFMALTNANQLQISRLLKQGFL